VIDSKLCPFKVEQTLQPLSHENFEHFQANKSMYAFIQDIINFQVPALEDLPQWLEMDHSTLPWKITGNTNFR